MNVPLSFASTWLNTALTMAEPVGWLDVNPVGAIIGHQRVRYRETARSIRIKVDAEVNEVADDAVLDGQGLAAVEYNPFKADAEAVDGQAAQADDAGRRGIDSDGGAGREPTDAAHAGTADDAD